MNMDSELDNVQHSRVTFGLAVYHLRTKGYLAIEAFTSFERARRVEQPYGEMQEIEYRCKRSRWQLRGSRFLPIVSLFLIIYDENKE